MFSKILIANRGEIAVRIIRACKEMGIATVAVYSTADKDALHAALADESVCIGESAPAESYLRIDRIISAAVVTGAEAIHPGYGFLSESAEFAGLCKQYGVEFIGPSPEAISVMGDKSKARQVMKKAGVPVIPGTEVLSGTDEALKAAETLGYPVLIKACCGGGGKGIRIIDSPDEMERAYNVASEEAKISFGDGSLYLEKQVRPAKHIEVQILADEAGNTISLAERECSIQKNNQKLLEESPSPAVGIDLRARLVKAATKASSAINYKNAGTVEFLLDSEGNFYFIEMNVRLQVEHGITEQISGIDIVKWQIRIAAGVPLIMRQKDVAFSGSSIECRINALGPGRVAFLHIPGGYRVRFDSALWTGYEVPPYYDPLLGKLIVHAGTREEAVRKMKASLCELVIDGVPNNIEEQVAILSDPVFMSGNYYTDFFDKRGD